MKKCSSCGTEITEGYVEFKCPACGKTEIVRCRSCRILGAKYICEACGFVGP
ncbi:MAG: RNA-binding protein [Candidatus Altiarchaeales archaeon]|nr:MAG: RNA-binding protein [Candidatus Altiarchaeales archaeon]